MSIFVLFYWIPEIYAKEEDWHGVRTGHYEIHSVYSEESDALIAKGSNPMEDPKHPDFVEEWVIDQEVPE